MVKKFMNKILTLLILFYLCFYEQHQL